MQSKTTLSTALKDSIFISDCFNIGILSLKDYNVTVISNKTFLQSINFDKQKNLIVAPGYSPEAGFAGLIYFNEDHQNKEKIAGKNQGFAPIRLYQYQNFYLMNSAEVLSENGITITNLGLYDTSTKKIIEEFKVPGMVKAITGNGTKAYLSSYTFPGDEYSKGTKKKSNIYEIDLVKRQVRKIFPEDQDYAPFELQVYNGYLYGVYQSAKNVPENAPQNLLVKIDLNSGQIIQKVQLNDYARDLAFSKDGRYAYVTHIYALFNQSITIDKPLTQVDLKTFKTKEIEGNYRAISIVEHDGKLLIGDDLDSSLTIVDEQTLKVEKKIPLKIKPLYLADQNKSGNQHVQ